MKRESPRVQYAHIISTHVPRARAVRNAYQRSASKLCIASAVLAPAFHTGYALCRVLVIMQIDQFYQAHHHQSPNPPRIGSRLQYTFSIHPSLPPIPHHTHTSRLIQQAVTVLASFFFLLNVNARPRCYTGRSRRLDGGCYLRPREHVCMCVYICARTC